MDNRIQTRITPDDDIRADVETSREELRGWTLSHPEDDDTENTTVLPHTDSRDAEEKAG